MEVLDSSMSGDSLTFDDRPSYGKLVREQPTTAF